MTEHICPDPIVDLWLSSDRRAAALAIAKWIDGIDAQDGDRIWLPDVGWIETYQLTKIRLVLRGAEVPKPDDVPKP